MTSPVIPNPGFQLLGSGDLLGTDLVSLVHGSQEIKQTTLNSLGTFFGAFGGNTGGTGNTGPTGPTGSTGATGRRYYGRDRRHRADGKYRRSRLDRGGGGYRICRTAR